MPEMSYKVQLFTDSVIRRMTRISDKYGAINLSQGFPDFDPPAAITKRLAQVAGEGPHQYSVTYGAENTRAAVAKKMSRQLDREIDPETEVLITCGGTEAMMSAMMTVCNPGDKVIIFSPFYENYGADAILSGAEPVFVPLIPPDYHYDSTVLEDAFRQGAKAIILNTPSNPCGKVFTRGELLEIAGYVKKYDTFVITDEVYEHIIYEPHVHTYFASLPGMYERTLSTSSLSKTYSITGWRLGYVVGPKEYLEGAKKVHDFLTVGAPAPLQEAATVGLEFGPEYYEQLREIYTEKRQHFLKGLDDIGILHNEPQGTYFVLLDIAPYLKLDCFAGFDDYRFCEWMIENIGVAAVPGSSFFKEKVDNLIRLHFAREKDTLDIALSRLARLETIEKEAKG